MNAYEPRQGSWEDTIDAVFLRKWYLIIPFLLGLIGSGVALYWIPPSYKSTTVILVEPQKVPENYVKTTVLVDIKDRLSTISQQVVSRTRLETIIKEFGLYADERNRLPMEEVVERMRGRIEINVKGKDSFSISYENSSPETAMYVTNKLSSLVIEENLKVREEQAEGTTQFLENQLQLVKGLLEEQEVRLRLFKQESMGELPSQLETNLRTLDRLQLDLQATNEALRTSEDRLGTLDRQYMEEDPNKTKLEAMKAELARLDREYTGKYPEVVRLRNEILEAEAQMTLGRMPSSKTSPRRSEKDLVAASAAAQIRNLNAEVSNLKMRRNEINRKIKLLQIHVENTPTREQQLSALVRDYENTKNNYQSLLEKKLDAQLSENMEKRQKGEQFRVLDPANLPERPVSPVLWKVLLAGAGGGLGMGVALVYLMETLDSSFRKAEDLEEVTGLPLLATLPTVPIRK